MGHLTEGGTWMTALKRRSSLCQMLVHPYQFRHAATLRGGFNLKAAYLHDGPVVLLVDPAQFRGHGGFIIEVGKAGVRVEGAGMVHTTTAYPITRTRMTLFSCRTSSIIRRFT